MDRASWLLKALHEASGEVYEHLLLCHDALEQRPRAASRARPHENSPAPRAGLHDIAWDLAAGEQAAAWHLEQLVFGREDRLALHETEWLTTAADSRHDAEGLARLYLRHRRDSCGLLWSLPPAVWEFAAEHPFRGRLRVADIAEDLHQRDLVTMWALKRLDESRTAAASGTSD